VIKRVEISARQRRDARRWQSGRDIEAPLDLSLPRANIAEPAPLIISMVSKQRGGLFVLEWLQRSQQSHRRYRVLPLESRSIADANVISRETWGTLVLGM
jgi:hypothetical protein